MPADLNNPTRDVPSWKLDGADLKAQDRIDHGLPPTFEPYLSYGYARNEADELVLVPLGFRSCQPVDWRHLDITDVAGIAA